MSLLWGVESYRSSRMVPVSRLPQVAPSRHAAEVHSLIPIEGNKLSQSNLLNTHLFYR